MTSARKLLFVAVAALGVLAMSASPAAAHNVLTGSDPADGAELAQGPAEVGLAFLASLDPDHAELSVTGPDGESAISGEPEFDGGRVTIPVVTALAGEYLVSYEVLSNDGHWVDGRIEFTVTEGEPPPTPTPSPTPAAPPASAPPTPAPAAATADSGGIGWWVWPVGLLAVLAAAGGFGLYRRRSRTT